jgi:hypothetical protein
VRPVARATPASTESSPSGYAIELVGGASRRTPRTEDLTCCLEDPVTMRPLTLPFLCAATPLLKVCRKANWLPWHSLEAVGDGTGMWGW